MNLFGFIAGYTQKKYKDEEPVNIPAAEKMGNRLEAANCLRVLSQLTAEFSKAGFLIERLVEPTPLPEMAKSYPESHERLSTEPGFVLFRLVKDRT